ncbi:MAG: hypothetical protein R3C18_26990 [Planctomycetaceae bacterium]
MSGRKRKCFESPLLGHATDLTPALQAQLEETAPRRPAKYHYRQDSPERIKIEKALETIIEPGVVLKGSPHQLMDAIGKYFGIQTGVNEAALLAEGIKGYQLELQTGLSLRQALDIAFSETEIELDYLIHFDVLQLTTRLCADEVLETVVYELRDLPEESLKTGALGNAIEDLLIIHCRSYPQQTSDEGTHVQFPGGVAVRQSQRCHRELLELLVRIREFNTGPPLKITTSDISPPRGEQPAPETKRIRTALSAPPPEGIESVKSIGAFCDFLDKACPFSVRLDEAEILAEGIGPETEIRVLRLNTLRNTLGYALSDVGGIELTSFVSHGTLLVTTNIRADEESQTELYDLAGLTAPLREDTLYLMPMIDTVTKLDFINGGGYSVAKSAYPECLIVSRPWNGHADTRNLFRQLREFSAQQGYPDPPLFDSPIGFDSGDAFGEPPPDTNFF